MCSFSSPLCSSLNFPRAFARPLFNQHIFSFYPKPAKICLSCLSPPPPSHPPHLNAYEYVPAYTQHTWLRCSRYQKPILFFLSPSTLPWIIWPTVQCVALYGRKRVGRGLLRASQARCYKKTVFGSLNTGKLEDVPRESHQGSLHCCFRIRLHIVFFALSAILRREEGFFLMVKLEEKFISKLFFAAI